MAVNTKLVLIGGAALALLMGSKKSSSKTSGNSGSGSGGSGSGSGNDDGYGDIGEPAGPKGCKPGLILKNGVCTESGNGNGENNVGGNGGQNGNGVGGGGSLKSSDLYVSKDCKEYKFGDKTGDSWWKTKGKKTAQAWIEAQYSNPIVIAYEMLKGNKMSCPAISEFPIQEKFKTQFDLQIARMDWMIKYPIIWSLIYDIRNKIDKELMNGITYVTLTPNNGYPKTWKFTYGKGWNFEAFWQQIQPLAYAIQNTEAKNPGFIMKKFGLAGPNQKFDHNDSVSNAAIIIFRIIFPYIDNVTLLKGFSPGEKIPALDSTQLYGNLWDRIADFENELDVDFGFEKL